MTRRHFLQACGTATALASISSAQQRKTKNLILVTADGLRWQDLFTGIDPLLMNQKDAGMTETGAPELRTRLWKRTCAAWWPTFATIGSGATAW